MNYETTLCLQNAGIRCPVKNRREKVERQREVFKREERFRWPKHKIFQKYDKIRKEKSKLGS